MSRRLLERPWRDSSVDIRLTIPETRLIPDAYRLRVEHRPLWRVPVLVLEMAEISVTHPLTDEKLSHYLRLWFAFDCSDRCHLRLYAGGSGGVLPEPMLDRDPVGLVVRLRRAFRPHRSYQ